MSERSNPEAEERARAAGDLEQIDRLKKFAPFRYFTRRISEEVEKTASRILDPGTKDDELHDLKVRHKTLEEISKMLEVDESGCRNVIATAPKEDSESQDSELSGNGNG